MYTRTTRALSRALIYWAHGHRVPWAPWGRSHGPWVPWAPGPWAPGSHGPWVPWAHGSPEAHGVPRAHGSSETVGLMDIRHPTTAHRAHGVPKLSPLGAYFNTATSFELTALGAWKPAAVKAWSSSGDSFQTETLWGGASPPGKHSVLFSIQSKRKTTFECNAFRAPGLGPYSPWSPTPGPSKILLTPS